jgi:hypothetical protein
MPLNQHRSFDGGLTGVSSTPWFSPFTEDFDLKDRSSGDSEARTRWLDYSAARDRTTVHRGSSHLQSLSQVPETEDALTFGVAEFAGDCYSPTVAPVGRHRRGICDILVMHTPAGSPWHPKEG